MSTPGSSSSASSSASKVRRSPAGWRALLSQALIVAGLAAVPGGLSAFLHPLRPPFDGGAHRAPEVSYTEVKTWADEPVWVDARKAADFQAGHVPGAVSLTLANFNDQLGAFLDVWEPGRRVVVYCDRADCGASQEVAARLRDEAGIPQVYVLAGGARDLDL